MPTQPIIYQTKVPKSTPQLSADTVSFTSNKRNFELDGKFCSNTTFMFRPGINWEMLPQKLEERFKDKEHVNIVSHACSDGSEAYTIAIALLEKLGPERAAKFFPIIAKDADKTIIGYAEGENIALTPNDLIRFKVRKIKYKKYFEPTGKKANIEEFCNPDLKLYKVKPELKNLVRFEQGNVFDSLNSLQDDTNTVFFFRNALPYFSEENQSKFFKLAGKKLSGKSMLVLGKYDFEQLGPEMLSSRFKAAGLKQTSPPDKLCSQIFTKEKTRQLDMVSSTHYIEDWKGRPILEP